MLYNTLIYPYLQYCNIAWASQQNIYTDKLFILQKKALRIVNKTHWIAHTSPLFLKLNTLKLSDINKLQTGCFMYRAMNNQLPSSFSHYFTLNSNIHQHFTRQSKNLHQFQHNTTLRKYSIKNVGTTLWNSLPITLKNKPSVYCFKSTYKASIISLYSIV
jgi:hypothetical protein